MYGYRNTVCSNTSVGPKKLIFTTQDAWLYDQNLVLCKISNNPKSDWYMGVPDSERK